MAVIGSQVWVIEKLSRHRRSLREIPEAALETYNRIDPALGSCLGTLVLLLPS